MISVKGRAAEGSGEYLCQQTVKRDLGPLGLVGLADKGNKPDSH